MTELQMGLIGLGATAIVGVLGFNKWQEYRQRKLAEALFKPQQQDALFQAGSAQGAENEAAGAALRAEPVLGQGESGQAAAGRADFRADIGAAPNFTDEPADEGDEATVSEVPVSLLDSRLEFVVVMELVDPVPVEQVLATQRSLVGRLNKPVHLVALNERTREWVNLSPASTFPVRRLRIGLQLVDRRGPLSENDLLLFKNAMSVLADELMAVASMPQFSVLEQATEIDRFCAAVDLEIGINLITRGNLFAGTKIRALAEAAGMVLGSDGAFVRLDDAGRVQFSLQNYENTPFSSDTLRTMTTHGLTFTIDVPRVENGERVFAQMTEIAQRFADTLQGTLVDDNCQPLSDAQLEHIRREFIGRTQTKMSSFGLQAGSPQALRLFS